MPRNRMLALVSAGVALTVMAGAVAGPISIGLSPPASGVVSAADDPGARLGRTLQLIHQRIDAFVVATVATLDELAAPEQGATADEAIDTKAAEKKAEKKAADKKAARKKAEEQAARKQQMARKERKRSKPSPQRRLTLVRTLTGGLTPKSIVSAQNGKVFAMNMMYGHTITVFNKRYHRAKVIDDSVDLSKFGYRRYKEKVQGAPVEAALDPRTGRMYVSNYSMYGAGFDHPGFDLCKSSDRIDRSFVYEIDTRTLRKTDAIRVGEVPKYLAVTPNGRYLLVGNWCSWDLSVVDLRKGEEVRRIPAGVAPRGIAFSPNSKTAYVTLVGGNRVLVIDMKTFAVKREISGVGERPRHLVMSPDGRYLYITVEGKDFKKKANGAILKYDTRKRRMVARSKPLVEPRTTVISDDGRSLYVVDYYPGTLVKLKAGDLSEIQTVRLGHHPIGVTYDSPTDKLWVAGYTGAVWVLKDR